MADRCTSIVDLTTLGAGAVGYLRCELDADHLPSTQHTITLAWETEQPGIPVDWPVAPDLV